MQKHVEEFTNSVHKIFAKHWARQFEKTQGILPQYTHDVPVSFRATENEHINSP